MRISGKRLALPAAAIGLLLLAAVIWMSMPGTADPAAVIREAESRLNASRAALAPDRTEKTWTEDRGIMPKGMEKIAESEQLTLYMNRNTTEFAVRHKPSNQLWYSNPLNREEDTIAAGKNKKRLSALLSLSYLTSSGQDQELDSYTDSVELGQFKSEPIEDGFRVTYTVGQIERGIESIPKLISKQRFEEKILNKLSNSKDVKDIKKRFKYDPEHDVYARREMTELAVGTVLDILDQVGYGEEDLAYDNKENGLASELKPDQAQYTIPLEIRLKADQLVVRVDTAAIKQIGTVPIHTLTLLELFGAADSSESGYMFVPDGSGALIHLNNGKTIEPAYFTPVYGEDHAIQAEEKLADNEPVRLPVFGLKLGQSAWLGIIEKGDGIASIKADVSGRLNMYNYTSPVFTLTSKDRVVIQGGTVTSSSPVHQKKPYSGNIVIRYGFLGGEEADYSGMAKLYRGYLADKYDLRKLEPGKDVPFLLELVGGVETRKSLLGVPYDTVVPLTTYDQAKDLVEQLKEHRVNTMKLRYTGWFNGGVNHSSASQISLDQAVGGEKSFRRFEEYLRRQGIDFYPDAAFLNVYKNGSGFRSSRDGIKAMSQKTALQFDVDMPTFLFFDELFSHYPLSPVRLPGVIDGFVADAKELGINGLSLRDLGNVLNSDFDDKKPVNREQSRAIVESQFAELAEVFPNLMVSGGNAYSLPYANTIVNAPLSANGFNIEDETVPFYQLVMHGYVDMAGKPFNQADDQFSRANMLKAIETGTNVYYRWVAKLPQEITSTEGRQLYANDYADWFNEAVQAFEEVNKALRSVRHLTIEKHEQLAEGVYRTVYEDGTSIIVNYNDKPVKVKDITVDAESYWIGGR